MKKFFVKNMGCKSNQLEGALIEENLIENGFEKIDKIFDADIFILNSCTVTHKSDKEAFYIVKQAKKQNPRVKVVITGCIAQIEKEKLLENPNIDIVLGNDEKLEISKYLKDVKCKEQSAKCYTNKLENLNSFHKALLHDTTKTRASLKIQDGCDNRCSYCIIPFARGKNRSAELDYILEQIKIYQEAGFKEVMLTGIHIGQWSGENGKWKMENGKISAELCSAQNLSAFQPFSFSAPQENLLYLLQIIEEQTSIERFRLGSLNPLEINDEMLAFLKNSKKFCPHFHLSIQSMCDKTIKAMNRNYSVKQTLELIEKISQIFPLVFIGSDIIVGFPGESDEDFKTTIKNLKKSKLTQIHTFPYSIRKGTVAEKFKNHLPQKIKEERAKIIKEISAKKHAEFIKKNIGTVQEVLIEKKTDKKTGFLKGITRNYINVLIEPQNISMQLNRTIQTVKIEDAGKYISAKIFE